MGPTTLVIIAAVVLFLLWILPLLFKVAVVVLAAAIIYGVYSGQFPEVTALFKKAVDSVKKLSASLLKLDAAFEHKRRFEDVHRQRAGVSAQDVLVLDELFDLSGRTTRASDKSLVVRSPSGPASHSDVSFRKKQTRLDLRFTLCV